MSDIKKFREDLEKVLKKHNYSRKEMDKYAYGRFRGVDVYPVLDGNVFYGQTVQEIIEEVFGNIGYKVYE